MGRPYERAAPSRSRDTPRRIDPIVVSGCNDIPVPSCQIVFRAADLRPVKQYGFILRRRLDWLPIHLFPFLLNIADVMRHLSGADDLVFAEIAATRNGPPEAL